MLRANAELRQGRPAYVELNTAVERDGVRGWLNIARWNGALACADGKTVTFTTLLLEIAFTGVDIADGCPAENAAAIPCRQVLGVYSVSFPRQD